MESQKSRIAAVITDRIGKRFGGGKRAPAWLLATCLAVSGAEGLRQTVYIDPVGIPTVCFGQTGKDIKPGQPARSVEECADLLVDEMLQVEKVIRQNVKVPLTNGEWQAYSSFIYNLGPGKKGVKDGFVTLKSGRQSTLLTLLNQGKHVEACQQIQYWNNPKWLRGLTIRRQEEMQICLRDLQAGAK